MIYSLFFVVGGEGAVGCFSSCGGLHRPLAGLSWSYVDLCTVVLVRQDPLL